MTRVPSFNFQESDIAALKEKLAMSEDLKMKSAEERDQLVGKLELLAKELEKSSVENQTLQTDVDSFRHRAKELDQLLEEKELTIETLKDSVNSQEVSSELEKKLAALTEEKESVTKQKEEEIAKMSELLKQKEEDHITALEKLQAYVKSLETEKIELASNLDKVRNEKDSLSSDFETFRKSNANFREQLSSVQELLTNMEKENKRVGISFSCCGERVLVALHQVSMASVTSEPLRLGIAHLSVKCHSSFRHVIKRSLDAYKRPCHLRKRLEKQL